ncbi:unnamed protein product, partial [Prorocentrum cordatum]
EVERARLAAVEALRRLEGEDQLGRARADSPAARSARAASNTSSGSREVRSGVFEYKIENGPDKGVMKQLTFCPKDASPEEVERARLAAVAALRRIQEEDLALGSSSSGGPYAGCGRGEAPAAPAEGEERLAAFRGRYPVDDGAFELLARQPAQVQSMVIAGFCPPEEGLSDYSALLASVVQTITAAARRPRQVATFSTGCFWKSQELFDRVSGVLSTTVGYTGGNTLSKPTYESVQLGDGHSEAIRIEFDPELITYDELLTHFDRIRERTPAPVGLAFAGGAQQHTAALQAGTKAQHLSAVWYHDEEQKKALQERARRGAPEVHAARMETWHDAERHHQKFYQKGCSVQ